MRQELFEDRHEPEWRAFEAWLDRREKVRGAAAAADAAVALDADIPARYRRLCQQLSLARDRAYGSQLIDRLNRLTLRGHHALYGAHGGMRARFAAFIAGDFPRLVREHSGYVWLAGALFFGPLLLMLAVLQFAPEFVYYVIPPSQVSGFEDMYRPGTRTLGRRPAESEFGMFGYYIWNNTRIGFQVFASGITFGIGTVGFLLFNGLIIGATAGHLTFIGYVTTFWTFVAGHSAFELTAIVLSGAAGLMLGHAVIAPGQRSRKAALMAAARPAVRVIYGAAGLFLAAAFVEAFWSPVQSVPPAFKYAVGIVLWLLLVVYFVFAGRRRGP